MNSFKARDAVQFGEDCSKSLAHNEENKNGASVEIKLTLTPDSPEYFTVITVNQQVPKKSMTD